MPIVLEIFFHGEIIQHIYSHNVDSPKRIFMCHSRFYSQRLLETNEPNLKDRLFTYYYFQLRFRIRQERGERTQVLV